MKKYRLLTEKNKNYIQHHKETLFGDEWETIHSFIGCQSMCEKIVTLLNLCDSNTKKIRKKIYDRIRHTET